MIHGNGIAASAESTVLLRALARAAGGWGGYQAWRQLDADRRLQVVEQALKASDGIVDDFSIAL